MDDNMTSYNWEQMYYEIQDKNKKLETNSNNLNEILHGKDRILMELQDKNASLHNELSKLTGKVEAFEFVFSHVKNINI